jgi:replication fork clamp-binding protein CrfC
MNNGNTQFNHALADTPPCPDSVADAVYGKLRKRIIFRRAVTTVVTLILVSVSVFIVTSFQQSGYETVAMDQEIIDELEYVRNYCTGADIQSEYGYYTVVDLSDTLSQRSYQ